jgi:phthiocerol/phenolphthiocerol synthesis type-I polyketide synthase E
VTEGEGVVVRGDVPEAGQGDPDQVRRLIEQCWCVALGVPSASAGDDFFALGGESLTAVNLLSRIEARTGIAVPVTEFSRDGTFGGLLRLAEQERSAHARPAVRVVALNAGGPGRPLFLAADAAGNVLSYRALAAELDGVRPVVGLEPAGAAAGSLAIEDSAAHHVAAVRQAQPSGPYTIGGWSFGAVLAHEMARRLTGSGERVDTLVCLDAVVPGRAGRPVGLDPGFLAGSLWLLAGATVRIGPAGRRVRQDPGLRRSLLAKFRVLARYRPRPAGCPAVVVKAGLSRRAATRLPARLSALYGGGVRVLAADGDHWTMLAPPHVRGLARSLREALSDDLDRKG